MRNGAMKYNFIISTKEKIRNDYNELVDGEIIERKIKGYILSANGGSAVRNDEQFDSNKLTIKIRNHYTITKFDSIFYDDDEYDIEYKNISYDKLWLELRIDKKNN